MPSPDAEALTACLHEIATAYRIGRDGLATLRTLVLKALAGGLRLNRDDIRAVHHAVSDFSDAFGLYGTASQPARVVVGVVGQPGQAASLVVALADRTFPVGADIFEAARQHDRRSNDTMTDWLLEQDRLHNAAFAAGIQLDDLAESIVIAAQGLRHSTAIPRGGDAHGERAR